MNEETIFIDYQKSCFCMKLSKTISIEFPDDATRLQVVDMALYKLAEEIEKLKDKLNESAY